jgi:hypothetical protein
MLMPSVDALAILLYAAIAGLPQKLTENVLWLPDGSSRSASRVDHSSQRSTPRTCDRSNGLEA